MAKDFIDLDCWRLSCELRELVMEIVARPIVARDFKYCDQCKDAARSAPSNIAEGFGRFKHKDFARFLRIAVGSLKETRNHLIDGHASGYVTDEELERGTILVKRATGATNGLIRFLANNPDPPDSW